MTAIKRHLVEGAGYITLYTTSTIQLPPSSILTSLHLNHLLFFFYIFSSFM